MINWQSITARVTFRWHKHSGSCDSDVGCSAVTVCKCHLDKKLKSALFVVWLACNKNILRQSLKRPFNTWNKQIRVRISPSLSELNVFFFLMKSPAIVTLDTCVHIYFTEHSAAFVAETLIILLNAHSWMIQHSDICFIYRTNRNLPCSL